MLILKRGVYMQRSSDIVLRDTDKLTAYASYLPAFAENYLYFGMSKKSIMTRLSYCADIKDFFEYGVSTLPIFKGKNINEITLSEFEKLTSEDIEAYLKKIKESGLSERTRARRKSSLSGLFLYLINNEKKLKYNPVAGCSAINIKPSKEIKYLSISEQDKLIETIKTGEGLSSRQMKFHDKFRERDLCIVSLFLDTGIKLSELSALDVQDLFIYDDPYDPENSSFYCMIMRKGTDNRIEGKKAFFSDETREAFEDYLEKRKDSGEDISGSAPLFVTASGGRLSGREIQQLIKKYAALSNSGANINPTVLRSSFAMEFYRSQKNVYMLRDRMGHKSMTSSNAYIKAIECEDTENRTRNWRINARGK